MFKLFNLIVTIVVSYWLFQSLEGFNRGFDLSVETGHYGMLIYKGFYSLFYTLWLLTIYVVMFGSSEIYVTTKNQE